MMMSSLVTTSDDSAQRSSLETSAERADASVTKRLSDAIQRYWGYESFRPFQLEAMNCVMQDRDSLVVFPTGGGKSLCFQAPALCREGLTVVVSPLISLMKDQVDALQSCGVPAECLNSSMTTQRQQRVLSRLKSGKLRLLYVAPERLLMDRTCQFLKTLNVSFFAIDEAHCVSEWGHDFRPDYRALSQLKDQFPNVAVHAYTATATQQVRDDIVRQLRLERPRTWIGAMDRPNLTYRICGRQGISQIGEVLQQHQGESGIVYCISRKDVESTSGALNEMGFSTRPYHAGMSDEDRRQNQEAFLREEIDTIVATVAFGMGIDKSNVRYVIHAAMPKSMEAFQQESGRAGRDGLDADCWLFYKTGDFVTWKRLLDQSESDAGRKGALRSLAAMSDFCHGVCCRHAALSEHFGQSLDRERCGACDVCLGELELIDDALIAGQKIVSCVARVEERFGAEYVAQVLAGSRDKRILQNKHERLSTHGLMSDIDRRAIRMWIDQLVSQSYLMRFGEYNVLQVTDTGRALLKGESTPRLTIPNATQSVRHGKAGKPESWEGVDRALFDRLKALRTASASELDVPAYTVFSDASLRDMARRRPSMLKGFHLVHGVGQKKLDDYGAQFVGAIRQYCQSADVAMDVKPPAPIARKRTAPAKPAMTAYPHFDAGKTVLEVATILERAESTVRGYLQNYIETRALTDPSRWVDHPLITTIRSAILECGSGPLKPIHVALGEKVSYNDIRIVMACMANEQCSVET